MPHRECGFGLKQWISRAAAASLLAITAWSGGGQPMFAADVPAAPGATPTSSIRIDVRAAVDSISKAKGAPKRNDPITKYRWLLNADNTGDSNARQSDLYCHPSSNIAQGAPVPPGAINVNYVISPTGYPEGCQWPSIRYGVQSPVLSEGTQNDWNKVLALPAYDAATGRGLPDNCPTLAEPTKPCRYLVSVVADGYQIGGVHFSVPMNTPGLIHVWLNPYPIPLGTIRIKVFPDISPTDGTWDQTTEASICTAPDHKVLTPLERCMAGFHATLADYDGIVSQDFFGNPLCTDYKKDPKTHLIVLDKHGVPTPMPADEPSPPDPTTGYYDPTIPGRCLSDTHGNILIPNLMPNRYSVNVTPYECTTNWNWDFPGHLPRYDCSQAAKWIQTTTLEGALDHDVWVLPNSTGLDPEMVVGGEKVPWVHFGFVDPKETSFLIDPVTCAANPTHCANGNTLPNGTGEIKGQLYGAIPYVPGINALPGVGGANGQSGIKLDHPIGRGWISVNSLDTTGQDYDYRAATLPTDSNGYFSVKGLRDGQYLVSVWDQEIEHAMDSVTITIQHGQTVDLGVMPLLGWFTRIYGHVFIDTNGNGRMDPGEVGLFHANVQILNRTNNSMEGGMNAMDTDNNGFYNFSQAYPLGLMAINQFFSTPVKTTGVTWQACNDPQEHTVIAPMVDVSFRPIIGHCGRLDWGVSPYDASHQENGGIVATARYDQLRLKYNARQAQTLDYQTGIPGFRVEQYSPIKGEGPGGTEELSGYALNLDGSYMTKEPVTPVNGGTCDDPAVVASGIPCYITENNGTPAKCFPRDVNGTPIGYDRAHPNSPTSYDFMTFGGACIETAAASTQIGLGTDSPPGCANRSCHGVQTVDGNYALPGSVKDPVLHGDVVGRMVSPVDRILPPNPVYDPSTGEPAGYQDRPLYSPTTEEDVNSFSGAQFIPQGADASALPWPPPALPRKQMPLGPLTSHDRGYQENEYTTNPGPDAHCAGPTFVVHVTNPVLAGNGGSPLEGATRHLCDFKLLHSNSGQSIAPDFHFHTTIDVPLPAHWWGYIFDDISLSADRKSTTLGEVAGLPYVPNGFYDWTGRLLHEADSDYNGVYEALMPSSELFNCPTPAGSCPNIYKVVGNDPGQPGAANRNYNPAFHTIAADFQAWPNILTAVDTAPTRRVPSLEGPGAQFSYTHPCGVPMKEPELFAVSKPYTKVAAETLQISGSGFGSLRGKVTFTPDGGGTAVTLPTLTWNDGVVEVTVGKSMPAGPGQLTLTDYTGRSTIHGLTFHVIKGSYTPHILEVGPGKRFDPRLPGLFGMKGFTIQDALEEAAKQWQAWGVRQVGAGRSVHDVANDANSRYLVVVYPNDPSAFTPLGTYYENLIIHSPLKLQGVGPGGIRADGSTVQGSIVDGRFFTNTTPGTQQFLGGNAETGVGLDNTEPVLLHWEQILEATSGIVQMPPPNPYKANPYGTTLVPINAEGGTPPWSGISEQIGEVGAGSVITVLATTGTDAENFKAGVDGMQITGGDQGGFTGNISEISGRNATGALAEPSNELEIGGMRWIIVQGGAIYLNGGTDHFQLTNNLVRANSGAYGSIRLGTLFQLDTPGQAIEGSSSHNYDTRIANNVIAFNGGTNLAGAVGIFDDSNGYRIDHNFFCQNHSAEYGGAISHFGYSPNGMIDHNRIVLNAAFDEGGAITIRSEPGYKLRGIDTLQATVPDPSIPTNGSGPVTIDSNYISTNLAQDDGGAIRLMGTTGTGLHIVNGRNDPVAWGLSQINIVNNMITDNTSAHEGGGIAMGDAPLVNIVNNTIAKNLTTATAITSNGCPAPAGISTGGNTDGLMALLNSRYAANAPAGGWPTSSMPTLKNNILWDNRAGSWSPSGVLGIGLGGDTSPINNWDVGTIDGNGQLAPTSSILSSTAVPAGVGTGSGCNGSGYAVDPSNQVHTIAFTPDPITGLPVDDNWVKLAGEFDLHLQILQQRTYFRFRPAAVISVDLPVNATGDYHLTNTSPAQNSGLYGPGVPSYDIDGTLRPCDTVDIGAHQLIPRGLTKCSTSASRQE